MQLAIDNDTVASLPTLASGDDLTEDSQWLRSYVGSAVGVLHRIVRHLASGGMGHVFLVEHVQLGAYAAVKLPQPSSQVARNVLAHEAVLLSQLQHPNIVSVLDFGRMESGLEYMMMEYVSGLELDAWLDSCGSMAPARALGILKQVASAVDYLHAHGIVHCDIKPANIMFDPRAHDFVKLIDFGIACEKHMQPERRGLVGTPAYMAPEQARGETCGAAVDIYGLAALALEILTGRPPYEYDTVQGALTAVLSEPPALPSTRGLAFPGLDAVFERGLHSDPAQRYQTATDFVEALESVFNAAASDHTAAVQALGAVKPQTSGRADTVRSRCSSQRQTFSLARSAVRGVYACACAALAALVPLP
jgi:eukaryotic-like serine/threonine-protein kinase